MEGNRLIKSLRLSNFLSYGSEAEAITLEPLNVLIGRNASGKSNLIEAFELLHAIPKSLANHIRKGDGISEYLWKGQEPNSPHPPKSSIEVVVDYPENKLPIRYKIGFTRSGQRMEIVDETIENEHPVFKLDKEVEFFYRYQEGQAILRVLPFKSATGIRPLSEERLLSSNEISLEESILPQRKDPDQYPELTYLGNVFDNIRIYGEFNLGNGTAAAFPQRADFPDDFLLENASNLGMVLDDLSHRGKPLDRIVEKLKQAYGEVDRMHTRIRGGTVQVFVYEKGLNQPIPATRLSDGTLRYLCLLTLLCHPEPPPLMCIEEPELGLHPDILPTIAELLIEASQRTQIIVTTHSDTLVSALSEVPESVLVCERDDAGTHLRRLEPDRLTEWLEKYSLGELWRMGEIGGNRW